MNRGGYVSNDGFEALNIFTKDVDIESDDKYDSGAISRHDFKAQNKHAHAYYEAIRKRTDDVIKIANNTGYSLYDIQRIKNHLFLTKHELGGDELEFFTPDFDQAVSWQNLCDGVNIREMDIILLKHELHELKLMQLHGMSYNEAHIRATQKYNYQEYSYILNREEGLD
jgi:hypothetical protein